MALTSSLDIIYEDDFIIALNKPPCTHSVIQKGSEESLALDLSRYLPGAASISLKEEDSGLVQRLDFMTSGVILGAKTREAWLRLKGMSDKSLIKKTYLTLVEGRFPSELTVESLLGSANRSSKKVRVYPPSSRNKRTFPASTRYQLLKYFPDEDSSAVNVTLYLGRRHQVRVHAASSGHPISGDTLYGSRRSLEGESGSPAFLLHARCLSLQHPFTSAQIELKAPVPEWVKKNSFNSGMFSFLTNNYQ